MQRNISKLANQSFDLLIVGGGIYGAAVAWDATLRGLSVALIEKDDFGHATSANSLKTIHGGLRYLQDADIKLVRMMIHERMTLMRIAPHLVHPLPCLMPTTKKISRSKIAMTAALALNDLLCLDKNRLPDPQKYLPRGRVLSRQECMQIVPGLGEKNITGGAVWHDAQMYSSERTTLSFIMSAEQRGAVVANYVAATGFLKSDDQIYGVVAKDRFTGQSFEIKARLVVNTAGPWVNKLVGLLAEKKPAKTRLSVAINLVVPQIIPNYAVGVRSWPNGHAPEKSSQLLFIAPWRNYSIAGTKHLPFTGAPDDYTVDAQTLQDFLDDINSAYPAAALTLNDVRFVHWGFLPADDTTSGPVKLLRRGKIYDHRQDGLDGLLTVVGVKYTSARYVAEQVLNLIQNKLSLSQTQCQTHTTPLFGGRIEYFDGFLDEATARCNTKINGDAIPHLARNYGTEYVNLLKYSAEDPTLLHPVSDQTSTIKAEVLHAVRSEMAQKLSDVVFRRTEMGSAGHPGAAGLTVAAQMMANELGWPEERKQAELADIEQIYTRKQVAG